MKTNYLLFFCVFLLACNSPEQLYKKGASDEAYNKLIYKKQRLSEKEKALLTEIHADKLAKEIKIIEAWSAESSPEIWPRIKGRLDRINTEQRAILKISETQDIPVSAFATFPNLSQKLEEAAFKAAQYYYDRQQKEYTLAQNGDKKAARRGYDLGIKTMGYISDFKNVVAANEEMKIIGMDYILVYMEGEKDFPPTKYCLEVLTNNWQTPQVSNWSTLSFDQEELERVDYWLRVTADRAWVGPPQWASETCTNSEEVQVGTREYEEWSEQDSAYVKKEEPIYEVVTIEVTNIEQYRQAAIAMSVEVIPNGKDTPMAEDKFQTNYRWFNSFGESIGDSRAAHISCSEDVGIECQFPSEENMLYQLGLRSKNSVQQFLSVALDTYEREPLGKRRGLFR